MAIKEFQNKKYRNKTDRLLQPSLCKNTHDAQLCHLNSEADHAPLSHTGSRQEQGEALTGCSAKYSSFEQKVKLQQIARLYHCSHGSSRTTHTSLFWRNRFLGRLYFLWLEIALVPARICYMHLRICKNLSSSPVKWTHQ